MAVADVLKEARARMEGGKLEPGDTYVFQCPDGLLILSNDEAESRTKAEFIAGGEVIHLKSTLDIATEPNG